VDRVTRASLSDILRDMDSFSVPGEQRGGLAHDKNAVLVAEAEWRAAIAALSTLLPTLPRQSAIADQREMEPEGIALSGPLPVLNEADFGHRLETWVATPQPLADALQGQRSLLPSAEHTLPRAVDNGVHILPLTLANPLLTERFCLVITPILSIGLVLGQPMGSGFCLQYSFDPPVLLALWQEIRNHIADTVGDSLQSLDKRINQTISTPDFRVITRFTQAMLANLPHRMHEVFFPIEDRGLLRFHHWSSREVSHPENGHASTASEELVPLEETVPTPSDDTELLQAMAHEIRTPLTTIRTLTRSLLRRKDVSAEVKKRLCRIDEECTQQIDRFNLIFRAVELETMERDRPRSSLTPIALTQIFQEAIPRWQQQAQRRNLNLDVTLPPDLPRVTSDPTLLNEVLSGVVEWFTQCLPPQTQVHMHVTLAGHQLKLQFEADPKAVACSLDAETTAKRSTLKSVGQLLTIVPETGGVSLNLDVTKNLFEFLGGKLIVRQRPEQGEVLTAFLPLDTREV
jgi:hypothetical protein